MNRSLKVSYFFIFLYIVFLGNANIYASNLSLETITSCCAEESEACCGNCHSEDSTNSDDCCNGNGCCGMVETRQPITISSPKLESEQKVSVEALRIKPILTTDSSLAFCYLLPECLSSIKVHFFTHSYRCNDRLAKMSIWRC